MCLKKGKIKRKERKQGKRRRGMEGPEKRKGWTEKMEREKKRVGWRGSYGKGKGKGRMERIGWKWRKNG